MLTKALDRLLYLYVYIDVTLFMTADRIEEYIARRRNDLPRA